MHSVTMDVGGQEEVLGLDASPAKLLGPGIRLHLAGNIGDDFCA